MQYDKLIRDRIPAIIAADGKTATVETIGEAEFREALRQKLVEEALEVREATPEDLATELADVLEVFDAILVAYGLTKDEVETVQAKRWAERGGFTERLRLLSVE